MTWSLNTGGPEFILSVLTCCIHVVYQLLRVHQVLLPLRLQEGLDHANIGGGGATANGVWPTPCLVSTAWRSREWPCQWCDEARGTDVWLAVDGFDEECLCLLLNVSKVISEAVC